MGFVSVLEDILFRVTCKWPQRAGDDTPIGSDSELIQDGVDLKAVNTYRKNQT